MLTQISQKLQIRLLIYKLFPLQFITAIESPLKAAGYNVQVVNVAATPGSIVVTSTTEFLDGSTTGAADFEAALSDSSSVSALFPTAVYGTAAVTSVSTESVTNPSKCTFCNKLIILLELIVIVFCVVLQVELFSLESTV